MRSKDRRSQTRLTVLVPVVFRVPGTSPADWLLVSPSRRTSFTGDSTRNLYSSLVGPTPPEVRSSLVLVFGSIPTPSFTTISMDRKTLGPHLPRSSFCNGKNTRTTHWERLQGCYSFSGLVCEECWIGAPIYALTHRLPFNDSPLGPSLLQL